MATVLRGLTWDHERGFDSIVGASTEYQQLADLEIRWEKRSLQAFADQGLSEIAHEFDFIVIDHPHIPLVASEGIVADLQPVPAEDFVGRSQVSYEWNGKTYGYAIDAAAQVSMYRPDRLSRRLETWDEVASLAKEGKVLWPLKPIDAFASTFTLCAQISGEDPGRNGLCSPEVFQRAWSILLMISAHLPEFCFHANPIEVAERLVIDSQYWYAPLGYGYSNYSRVNYRSSTLRYDDIPSVSGIPEGSMLGGAGLSISAFTAHPKQAQKFASWVATGAVQSGVYFEKGGQPGHVAAWQDHSVNSSSDHFFQRTLATLEHASLRPRHPGFMHVQNEGSELIHRALLARDNWQIAYSTINPLFESLAA